MYFQGLGWRAIQGSYGSENPIPQTAHLAPCFALFSSPFLKAPKMYKKLLLAYNGSVAGQKALLESRELAQWGQAGLHLVAVMPMALNAVVAEGIVFSTEQEAAHRKGFEQVLAQGLSALAEQGFAATGELLLGDPVHEICACAKRIGADLIVVGHEHKNSWVQRWWHASISPSLIEEAPCSVLVSII
jgi:nucleotide-binding universal stress UspA family protein